MSEEKKPDRPSSRSVRRPAAEAPADEAPVNSEGGGDEPAPTPKAAKGPVAVGRSLEISLAPDVCMDMLIDKLKLLDYEKEFCRRKKPYRKPLTRLYFAYALPSGNQAEQFFYFTGLMSWLLGQAGVEFKEPKEFDDPNMSCNNLITSIKKLGFAAPTYPAMKLTTGYGKEVCGVVDGVVDYVLERRNYSYRKPVYLPDGYVEEAGEGGDDDDGMDAIDEFKLPEFPKDDLDDDDAYMDLGGVAPAGKAGAKAGDPQAALDPADKAMLTSKVDPTLWKLELERVGPKLRILLNADAKDWRTNLEEVQNNSKAISSAWPDSRTVLEKLRGELNTSLEKLTTREKFLNEQFDRLMQQYRAQRSQLQDIQGTYNKHTEAISDRNNELHRISEQLTEMKTMMEERGSNISDATPVVRMKGAIKKLSDELHEMEVRIGVVSHTLLQLSLKNRRLMHAQAAVMSDEDDI